MKKVSPIRNAPAAPAFAGMAEKINELAAQVKPLKAGKGVKVVESNEDIMVSLSDNAGTLPTGYTFEEFTICDSGSPATRWWPTWTSNPEA